MSARHLRAARPPLAPTRRSVLSGALSGLMACSTAALAGGCAAPRRTVASGAAPGPSALGSSGPVSLSLWHGLGGQAGTALAAAVDDFNRTNPHGITAQAVYQGSYVDVQAKYIASLRDGSTPALLLSSDTTTGFMHDVGTTTPAQALAEANPDDLDLDDLRPAARNYYTVAGTLVSVPFNTSLPLLYASTSLLERAGVDPASLTTMAGLDTAARAVAEAVPGVRGLVQPMAQGWWFEQVTAAAGEPYVTPGNGRDGREATALSLRGPTQVAALQVLTGLHADGVALDIGTNDPASAQAFTAGQVALMLGSSTAISGLTAAGARDWVALPLPLSGDPSTAGPLIGGASLWVDGASASPATQVAAWKLVTHLTSATTQETFSRASGYAPINLLVDSSPTQQEFLAANPAWQTALEQFNSTPVTGATAGALTGALPAVREQVVAQMQRAYAGAVPLDDAVEAAERAAQPIIDDYREQAAAT